MLLPVPKIFRRLVWACIGLLAILIAMPYIVARQPFRDWMFQAVLPVREGTVTCGGASLGWFSRVEFRDIEIKSLDGKTVVHIPRFEGNRALLYYLVTGKNLGKFRIERPEVNVVGYGGGETNLRRVFVPKDKPPDVSVAIEIVDASVSFQSPHATEPWSVEDFNLSFALEPSSETESGRTEVVVERGTLFDRTPITAQMCDDMLKYIAPVLADASDIEGSFSIEIEDWRMPLGDPHSANGSGCFTIHKIDIGGGPFAKEIARTLRLPGSLNIVDESEIQFAMADGRIEHRDLQFGIGAFQIRTHGSVGLDQTIDLVAGLPLSSNERLGFLAGKTLELPITGTLSEPRIDAAALGKTNLKTILAGTKLEGVDVQIAELIENPDGDAVIGAIGTILEKAPPPGELIERFRSRRESLGIVPDGETESGPSGGPSPPDRPLLRLLRDQLNR